MIGAPEFKQRKIFSVFFSEQQSAVAMPGVSFVR
jgi:hypothetical protein